MNMAVARWRYEAHLFFTALAFLTRIPSPQLLAYESAHMSACSRYFPLVGLLVGGVSAGVFTVLAMILPAIMAVVLSVVLTIWMTGAFHEDGFADCCDGFGGGWERDQILTIMKDSCLGTYGVVGLVSVLAIKVYGLSLLLTEQLWLALLVGHCWSRLVAISYLLDLDYVQDIDKSKVKPMTTKLSLSSLVFAIACSLPLVLLMPIKTVLLIVVVLLVFRWVFARYLKRRLGGYTGDCLGMAQQFSELLIYLCLLVAANG